jgi:hypothetical protein
MAPERRETEEHQASLEASQIVTTQGKVVGEVETRGVARIELHPRDHGSGIGHDRRRQGDDLRHQVRRFTAACRRRLIHAPPVADEAGDPEHLACQYPRRLRSPCD